MDLWDKAKDGTRVTEVEKQTLRWVAENLDLTEKGRAFLQQQLNDGSYYTSIGRNKYSRALLEKAQSFSEKSISQQQAVDLWDMALDGERLGDCERRTLRYILQNLTATTGAKKFLMAKLDPAVTPDESQREVKSKSSGKLSTSRANSQILSPECPAKRAKTGDESLYRVIDGVKYDRVLLEKAEGAAARNSGLMNLGDVAALWDDASSDGSVNPLEKETLSYVLAHFTVSTKASKYLESKLHPRKPGSFFKTVDRIRCDKELLDKAQGFADAGNISEEQAVELWSDAIDGGRIIDCEVRTLRYIVDNFSVSVGAQNYLEGELKAAAADELGDADMVSPNFSPPPASPRASASRRSAASTVPETASEAGTPAKAKAKATPASPKAATPKAATPKASPKVAASPKVPTPKAPQKEISSPKASVATPKSMISVKESPKASPAPSVNPPATETPKATPKSPAKATPKSPAPKSATSKAPSPAPKPSPAPAAPVAPVAPVASPRAGSPEAPRTRVSTKSPASPGPSPASQPSKLPSVSAPTLQKAQSPKGQAPLQALGACVQREKDVSEALEKAKTAEQRQIALQQEIERLENSFSRAAAAADKARAAAKSAETAAERAGKEQHMLEQTLQAKKQEAEEAAKEAPEFCSYKGPTHAIVTAQAQRKTELEKALAEAKLQREKAEDAEKTKPAMPKAAAQESSAPKRRGRPPKS
eukprot:symbB.v1.2.013354.t1/scaffold942.1/size149982/5